MKSISLILSLFMAITSLIGQTTIIWTGTGDGVKWQDVENWDLSRNPMAGDSVVIDGTNVADSVLIGDDTSVKNVLLINGAELSINVDGLIKFTGSLNYAIRAVGSDLNNYGSIVISDVGDNDISDRAIELLSASSFKNYGNCTIEKSNGFGIRSESGSNVTNFGDINVHSESKPAIYTAGLFTNNGNITVSVSTADHGIITASSGQFINGGIIDIEVQGVNAYGLSLVNGGHLTNAGSIDINASAAARGISMGSSLSKIDLDDGNIDIILTNAAGIRIFAGELSIDAGAQLSVMGTPQDYLMEIDSGVILDCQGVLDLQN